MRDPETALSYHGGLADTETVAPAQESVSQSEPLSFEKSSNKPNVQLQRMGSQRMGSQRMGLRACRPWRRIGMLDVAVFLVLVLFEMRPSTGQPSLTHVVPTNAAVSATGSLTLMGLNFEASDVTVSAYANAALCDTTTWSTGTTIKCKQAQGTVASGGDTNFLIWVQVLLAMSRE